MAGLAGEAGREAIWRALGHLLGALGLLWVAMTGVSAAEKGGAMKLDFAGTEYRHRWSNAGQSEFTPANDADLARWADMITLNVHAAATDGDGLAGVANAVLGNYEQSGRILRTDSKPLTGKQEAEHFAAALLPGQGFMEAAFARFVLVDGTGMVVVRSHREYGADAATKLGAWVQANGPKIEEQLMAWSPLPKASDLARLPQSK